MSHYTLHKYDKDAQDALMRGAYSVYKSVSTTQGPRGRNIAINKGFDVEVLHDGLKVSRYVNPKDKFEALGAHFLREAAEKQVATVGDGTTLTIVLGYNIAREAMTLVQSGVNPMDLIEGLEQGKEQIIKKVKELAKEVKTKEQKIQVATVSAQDKKLGELIGSTYHKIGAEGVITADESKSYETTLEHQEGITLDKGYLSWKFITDPKSLTATVRDAHILFLERELEDIYEFVDFAKNVLEPNNIRNLVVIAKDVRGQALASLGETRRQGKMNVLCVKAPSFDKYQTEMLNDLAVMCGGNVIDEESGKRLGNVKLEDLGFAKVVKSSRESTTILENKGSVKAIKDRIASIKMLLENPDSDLDREKLRERLSKMTGGVYVIKTGGGTELEMNERKERVEDAILATRAAIVGGIVPGGEVTLLTAREVLSPTNENEEYAYRILKNAVEKPFGRLLTNTGLKPDYYLAKLEDKPYGWGVNVVSRKLENLIESGIVDPALVVTDALRAAVSVAILLITTNGLSVIEEDKEG